MTSNLAEAGNLQGYAAARSAIAALPSLPSNIRYLDEYEDDWKTIRHPADSHRWVIEADTTTVSLDFEQIVDDDVRILLKHFLCWVLQTRSPRTAEGLYYGVMAIKQSRSARWFLDSIERPVFEWQSYWETHWRTADSQTAVHAAKMFLHFLCEMCLGEFRPGHVDFVRSLPFKWRGNYQGVISGESILTADEEAKLIEHLDYVTERAAYASDEELAKACLLCISYQHGLRPVQITRLNLDDLRIYPGGADGPLVHFLAYRAKKRKAGDKTAFVRKIKLEWAPLLVEYHRRRRLG